MLHCPINGPNGTCSWLFPGSGLEEGNKNKICSLGASRAVAAVPLLSHILCLIKDKWGNHDSLKLIFLYLSISPCKRRPHPAAAGSTVFAWPLAGQGCAEEQWFSAGRRWMNPFVLGLEGLQHCFLRPVNLLVRSSLLQKPDDGALNADKSKIGVSVIQSCPILSHIVETCALENCKDLLIAVSPRQLLVTHFKLIKSLKCFRLWSQMFNPNFPRDWKITSRPFMCETSLQQQFLWAGQVMAATTCILIFPVLAGWGSALSCLHVSHPVRGQ